MKAQAQERGIVLLSVLVMLVVASAWGTYAWRQVFWQQRMLHSQGLEQMAWHAAEAGALQVQHRLALQLASSSNLAIVAALPATNTSHALPGSPSSQWHIVSTEGIAGSQPNAQALRISIAGQVAEPSQSSTRIAQAHLLVDIEHSSAGLRINRWQRVYPR
jgi:Tfp pilus assembly protein PilX